MEPVTNTSRVAALLRQRLLERFRAKGTGKAAGASSGEVGALHALAGAPDVDERHLKRALVQDILSDELGSQLLNEAQFQQVVEKVIAALEDDEGSSKLLATVITDLRSNAR